MPPDVLLPLGVSFAAALVLTPLAALVARRAGVVDRPGGRKTHGRPMPLLGGAAILGGVLAGAFAGAVLGRFAAILAAAGAVFAVGLLDDCRGAPVWLRLVVEAAAAAAVVASGTRATFLVGHAWIAIPVTIVWIVGITNAFNLLDNMDGLSAGVAAIAAIMFMLVCVGTMQVAEAGALASVAGAAAGFLVFNFKPARVFMGDAGSLALGFLLGSLSVEMTFYRYEGTLLPLAAPLLVLALPLFDTASVLWIRFRRGAALTTGDRNHFSHRLVALGMSERAAVVTIYLAATAIGIGAVLLKDLSWWGGALLLAQAALVFGIVVMMETSGMRKTRDDR
jgi:UDP-GlcNAc:undecaprenyl-phosphate GlcNAc-1-phosphate transferase